jgi:hypothetical protein
MVTLLPRQLFFSHDNNSVVQQSAPLGVIPAAISPARPLLPLTSHFESR